MVIAWGSADEVQEEPHMALSPQTALKPCVPLDPHTAELPHTAEDPQTADDPHIFDSPASGGTVRHANPASAVPTCFIKGNATPIRDAGGQMD